jgi:Mg-chelatase subunit ChlD
MLPQRFYKDETSTKPAKIDIVLLIDGSASMSGSGPKATKIQIAMLSAVILYEAAKQVDADVYIALWGGMNPVLLAKPGDPGHEIGQNIVTAMSGLGSSTNLAPSIKFFTKLMSEAKQGSNPHRGYTHVFVISDGDISDGVEAEKAIDNVMDNSDYATFDFAVIKDNHNSTYMQSMETMVNRLEAKYPTNKIGLIVDNDPATIPGAIVGKLFEKMQANGSFRAIAFGKKRQTFRRAQRNFEP